MRLLPILLLGAVIVLTAQDDTSDPHLAAAQAAAGSDWQNLLQFQCYGPGPQRAKGGAAKAVAKGGGKGGAKGKGGVGKQAGPPSRETWYREPVKVADNLYFVGQSEYSAWAITTSQGIILIDTLFDYSVEEEVVNGMKKLGLNPADIKYAIVSHPHPDHDGGAKFLQDNFGTRVIMSPADWAVIDARTNGTKPRHEPQVSMEATDGQKLTLGDTTITMYVTPGHTPGTLSYIFPIKDKGVTHTVALWGGVGLNQDRTSVETYIKSAQRFREIARQAGADIILSNHTDWDGTKVNLPRLMNRQPGSPNPYVVGNTKVLNFLKVAEECATSRIN